MSWSYFWGKGHKFRISSSLAYYKETGMIQLSHTDKPGDLLPAMTLYNIKNTPDLLAGLHPIDVNSINDLYYLSQNKISRLKITENFIQVIDKNGNFTEYNINQDFTNENTVSKRVSFLIGYMQAEKLMRQIYSAKPIKYKIIKDHITTLDILDTETQEIFLRDPMNILFSDEYKHYSKQDIARIGFICGQMSNL